MARTPDELQATINELRHKVTPETSAKEDSQHSHASRLIIELVSCLAVGGGVGYYLDDWLNTTPLFIIICGFFGCIAGFMTVLRVNSRYVGGVEKDASLSQQTLDK